MLLPGVPIVIGKGRWPGRRRAPRLQGPLLYREVQGYGWPWPGIPLVLAGVSIFAWVAIPFGLGMWQQLALGRPWGDKPMPDGALCLLGPTAILLSLLPLAALLTRLQIEVRVDGIRIEMVRFKGPHVISRDEVRAASLTRIGPFGWGSSRQGNRQVYRMAGSEGVEVELTSGKKVVLGSEYPRRLLDAVRSMIEAGPGSQPAAAAARA